MAPANYSAFAIPAYYILSFIPHAYAVHIIKRANNGRWDNANPRSSNWNVVLQKSVPANVFARYERAKAAHHNCMENFAAFSAAIILGNVAQLPPGTLNTIAAAYLLARIAYTFAYINIASKPWSFLRSGVFSVSVALSLYLMVGAAIALAKASE
jgi:uncharacterized MAPEG superfamily protein